MLEEELIRPVEAAVRALATAARALRLYPAASPLPRQSAEAAVGPLEECLRDRAALVLSVARDGFTVEGTPVAEGSGGASEIADMLREHGVAEIAFLAGVDADQLLSLLEVVMRDPAEVHESGGVSQLLTAAGVTDVRVVSVSLQVAPELEQPGEDEDVDEFFRELAFDSVKLATWLAAATHADTYTLAAGLGELSDAAGADGRFRFFEAFAAAFMALETPGRDALLGLGLEPGPTRDIVGGMLGNLTTPDISAALAEGVYGSNMLSMSTALVRLPFGNRMDDIIAEVRASLPELGKGQRELEFLDHMVEVRLSNGAEDTLADIDPLFRQVLDAYRVDPAMLELTRAETVDAVGRVDVRAVTTMLALLDQQTDFGLYAKSLDGLAALVPKLIAQGDVGLAVTVLQEIAERESRATQPWPELTQRLRAALASATSRDAMGALLDALVDDPERLPAARDIMQLTDDAAKVAFVEDALGRRSDEALRAADALLGGRMVDMLATAASRVPTRQVGPLVRMLSGRDDARTAQVLETLVGRPEDAVRAEVAEALGTGCRPSAVALLTRLLRDPAPRVVTTAARALAHCGLPGAADALALRLGEMDVDGRDFAAAREIIGWLAQMPDDAAHEALVRLSERKQLIKRGKFAEVQQLARDALTAQSARVAR